MVTYKRVYNNVKKSITQIIKKIKSPYCINGIFNGIVHGWIISTKGKPVIEVFLNGNYMGRVSNYINAPHINPDAYIFYHDLKEYDLKEGDELLLGGDIKRMKPIILSKGLIFGYIEGFSGCDCLGWAGTVWGNVPDLKVRIDEDIVEPKVIWFTRDDFRKCGINIPIGFKFKIPEKYLDGLYHKIQLWNAFEERPIGKEKKYIFEINHIFIDLATEETIAGWLQIAHYPGPIDLDIYINHEKIGRTRAEFPREDAEKVYGPGCLGFYYSIPEHLRPMESEEEYNLAIYVADTKINLTDHLRSISELSLILRLENLASSLREKGEKSLCFHINEIIENMRKSYQNKRVVLKNVVDVVDVVDVIIPVYKGFEETIECIESVLKAKNVTPFEVIVIEDCSPDPRLREALLRLSEEKKIRLIQNEINLGFVGSVNIGMKLHPNRDVVLLNSDTVVPDFWLDRLKRAVYSKENIATATPLSNRATILSIPIPNFDNDLPQGFSIQDIDALCQRVNQGIYVEIPTAIGFCMYIRRECLKEVGYFDEEKFGKGYGEENDFCLRASALGWKHIAVLDLFVYHHGSLSFGEEKSERVNRALEVITKFYPDYPHRIKKFVLQDPISPYRNQLVKELIKMRYESFVLFVLHTWGGGTLKYCLNMAELLDKEGIGSLFFMVKDGKYSITLVENEKKKSKESFVFYYPTYRRLADIAKDLADLPISFIHYNHIVNFKDTEIWELPDLLNIPYYITIHDYFYICPRINLITSGGIFCDLPEVGYCEECLSDYELTLERDIKLLYEGVFNKSIEEWREFYGKVLRGARKVIFPSESSKRYYEKIFSYDNFFVQPHPDKIFSKIRGGDERGILKIAIIGAIGVHKGYHMLLKLVEYAEKNNLPFEFIIFGYTYDDRKLSKFSNVTITGPYKSEEELSSLIRSYSPDIALFLHLWPETYNYTLSEALRCGLYPVVVDLGAPAERIRELGVGTLISYPPTIDKIVKEILSVKKLDKKDYIVEIEYYYTVSKDYYGFN